MLESMYLSFKKKKESMYLNFTKRQKHIAYQTSAFYTVDLICVNVCIYIYTVVNPLVWLMINSDSINHIWNLMIIVYVYFHRFNSRLNPIVLTEWSMYDLINDWYRLYQTLICLVIYLYCTAAVNHLVLLISSGSAEP